MPPLRTVQRHSNLRLRSRHLVWASTPWLIAAALSGLLFTGCPLFPENGCFVDDDCARGYACVPKTGQCVPTPGAGNACTAPEQCGFNETCSRLGVCTAGDCTFSGCVEGYACDRDDGVWACVPLDDGAGGMGGLSSSPNTPPAGGAPAAQGGEAGQTATGGEPAMGGSSGAAP